VNQCTTLIIWSQKRPVRVFNPFTNQSDSILSDRCRREHPPCFLESPLYEDGLRLAQQIGYFLLRKVPQATYYVRITKNNQTIPIKDVLRQLHQRKPKRTHPTMDRNNNKHITNDHDNDFKCSIRS
jgi:hypothetical protein